MKQRNSFKEIEREQLSTLESPPKYLIQNIRSNTSTFRFLGDIVELFFPKLIKIFVNMANGPETRTDEKVRSPKLPPNLEP